MNCENSILIRAPLPTVFAATSDLERWPEILPHYRWIRVLGRNGSSMTVQMAARRDVISGGLGFPLQWTAVETTFPARGRIEFEHVGGITRGHR